MRWLALVMCIGCSPAPPAEDAAPKPAPAREITSAELCTVYCERAASCGVYADACERDCPGRGRDVSSMKMAYVGRLMLCLDSASCQSVHQELAWKGCHDAVVNTMPLTKTLRRFCFESSRRAAQCKRTDDADQSACLQRFRYQKDSALHLGLACLKETCGGVPPCLAKHLVP